MIRRLPKRFSEPGDMTPDEQLMLTMLVLRGGRASAEKLIADCQEWERENGPATYDKDKQWIAANEIGLDIGMTLCDRVVEGKR